MMHMETGIITKTLTSPLLTGGLSNVTKLHPDLQSNDVLVVVRGFCTFAHPCLQIERDVEAVLQVHHQTNVDFTPR
jgi:hypothetical protein